MWEGGHSKLRVLGAPSSPWERLVMAVVRYSRVGWSALSAFAKTVSTVIVRELGSGSL